MTSGHKGAVVEMLFCAQAGARGYDVLLPMIHSSTVDVWVVKAPGRPSSVQVKTGWFNPASGRYEFRVQRGNNRIRLQYQKGDFDILAGFLQDSQEFVLWRFEEISQRTRICYTPRLHRQPGNWELLEQFVAP